MSPLTYEVVSGVSARYGMAIALILGRCRAYRLVLARVEIAKRLHEHGYSTSQIGRALNRDHTTIVYYLGTGKKQQPRPRWRRPRVKHVCWIKAELPPKVLKAMRQRYLVPYAGADMTEYVWRRRVA